MPFIEAPTTFYLGRRYDPHSKRLTDEVVYYDSRDLTTHALVVGMTGSGKTGLCISLLEEAILDNIPAIVIDPKGDITNLLLNFPTLQPADFEPWVNVDDARRAGLSIPAYAADIAQRWREGLANWGIVPDRMRWLKYAARYSIYTPGSDAGLPVSILVSLRAPREGWAGGEETHRERINGVVTALLALAGRNAQPVQDKEHVLVANIFEYAWQRGIDLTLEDLILQVQRPPFTKLGVFQLDDYISERERQKLAMDLNSIVAAPSFRSWLEGDPLDIHNLLYAPDGRPRVSIFYIAHLSEVEKQFVITLLLENTLGWMRTQSGTTSLRALLYIDEMFGYFPPYPRNPPTKEPLLRLLKQARAYGLGLILATQNPGDLDYKGLTNAGTWFIGRLQAENDKRRVMSGLEAMASMHSGLNLNAVERVIADLEPRVFLMHNVHDPSGPILVHTRWAMSYLRGPLTRQQVQTLMTDQRRAYQQPPTPLNEMHGESFGAAFSAQAERSRYPVAAASPDLPPGLPEFPPDPPEMPTAFASPQTVPAADTHRVSATRRARHNLPPGFSDHLPALPSTTVQYFLPTAFSSDAALRVWEQRSGLAAVSFSAAALVYRPVLLAQASVRFQDRKTQVYTTRQYAYHVQGLERAGLVHWEEYAAQPVDVRRLSGVPFEDGLYSDLPPGLTDVRRLTALKRELVDMLYTTARLVVPYNAELEIYGQPDSGFSHFRAQVQQAAREQRDAEVDALTRKYEAQLDRLELQLQRHAKRLDSEQRELSNIRREELFTTGEALIGLLRGRTSFTLSRMSRAAVFKQRSRGQAEMHQLNLELTQEEITKTQQEFSAALNAINERWAKLATQAEEYVITPYKKDINVDVFGIGWLPHWYLVVNDQPVLIPAYG